MCHSEKFGNVYSKLRRNPVHCCLSQLSQQRTFLVISWWVDPLAFCCCWIVISIVLRVHSATHGWSLLYFWSASQKNCGNVSLNDTATTDVDRVTARIHYPHRSSVRVELPAMLHWIGFRVSCEFWKPGSQSRPRRACARTRQAHFTQPPCSGVSRWNVLLLVEPVVSLHLPSMSVGAWG